MFVYPHLPPKEYVLTDARRKQLSSAEFTPTQGPRITLTTWGQYAVPVEASVIDPVPPTCYVDVNPDVMKTWVKKAKHEWMSRPGEDAQFLHDLYRKYNVVVCDSYDSKYMHRVPVFPRSFKYELDCTKEYRLQKLEEKMILGQENDKRRISKIKADSDMPEPPQPIYQASYIRWQEKPALFAPSQEDPCKRRAEFALVGQPFQNEACNWYYENYPPPKLKLRIQKFS